MIGERPKAGVRIPGVPSPGPSPTSGEGGAGALEAVVATVLRWGVVAATTLIVMGTTLSFVRHPEYRTSAKALQVLLDPATSRAPGALLSALPQLRGQPFVLLGIILLVATPFIRVAATAGMLARLGERRLALFGLAVLALLLASFFLGTAPT